MNRVLDSVMTYCIPRTQVFVVHRGASPHANIITLFMAFLLYYSLAEITKHDKLRVHAAFQSAGALLTRSS